MLPEFVRFALSAAVGIASGLIAGAFNNFWLGMGFILASLVTWTLVSRV